MKPAYSSPRVQTWPCLPCTQAHWSQKASSSSCLQTATSMWQSDAWTKESDSSTGAGAFCHQLCNYLWKFKYGSESCHALRTTKVESADQSDWTSGQADWPHFPLSGWTPEPGYPHSLCSHLRQLAKTGSLHRSDANKGWKEERTQCPTQPYK